jgi:hypothetical protein
MSGERLDVEKIFEDLWSTSRRLSNGNQLVVNIIDSIVRTASNQFWERDFGITLQPGDSTTQIMATIHGRVIQFSFKCQISDNTAVGIARAHLVSQFPEIEGMRELGGFKFSQSALLEATVNGAEVQASLPTRPPLQLLRC